MGNRYRSSENMNVKFKNITKTVVINLLFERILIVELTFRIGRRGGLMVSALVSRSSGPGSSPGRGHCVVFLGKTLYSHSASLHPGV